MRWWMAILEGYKAPVGSSCPVLKSQAYTSHVSNLTKEDTMGFKPTQTIMTLAYRFCPPLRPYLKAAVGLDKGLDQAGDRARQGEKDLVDKIRERSTGISLLGQLLVNLSLAIALSLLVGACASPHIGILEREGHELSRWDKTRLTLYHWVIRTDDSVDAVMDYEVGE